MRENRYYVCSDDITNNRRNYAAASGRGTSERATVSIQCRITFMNKYIIITGGNGDIGFSICERLLHNGFDIILFSLHNDKLQFIKDIAKKYKRQVIPFTFDIQDKDQLRKVFKKLTVNKINIYGLVNNIGIY